MAEGAIHTTRPAPKAEGHDGYKNLHWITAIWQAVEQFMVRRHHIAPHSLPEDSNELAADLPDPIVVTPTLSARHRVDSVP